MTPYEIETTASYLYDGGWRSTDRKMLLEEYGPGFGLTAEDADAICAELARIEDTVALRNEDDRS